MKKTINNNQNGGMKQKDIVPNFNIPKEIIKKDDNKPIKTNEVKKENIRTQFGKIKDVVLYLRIHFINHIILMQLFGKIKMVVVGLE